MNFENIDTVPVFNFDFAELNTNEPVSLNKNNFINEVYDIKLDTEKRIEDFEKFKTKLSTFADLKNKYLTLYHQNLDFISRAPGRVNIIGEHIDYAGFSVLPMAVENDILVATGLQFDKDNYDKTPDILLQLNHVLPDNYSAFIFKISKTSEFNLEFVKPHTWVNYLIAGFNSIIKGLNINNIEVLKNLKVSKINLLVTGNIPCASGLSSSSALTVAGALSCIKILNLEKNFAKFDIANATINYERSVGTACGGMDQTISICAEKGNAKLIEFTPRLNAKTVNLPNSVSFIIANSLTQSTKIDTLAFRYNKRVVENKLGLSLIAKNLKLDYIPEVLIELKNNFPNKNDVLDYSSLFSLIDNNLNKSDYSLEEIKIQLGEEVIHKILEKVPYYDEVLMKNTHFSLHKRLVHVCKEAERVEKFYEICDNNSKEKKFSQEAIQQLGQLMNDSHVSCKELYECSSTELDKLVDFSLSNGAIGARLTGAGWGGCSVIMVNNGDLDIMLEKLKCYYELNFNLDLKDKDITDYFFYTKASQGACLLSNL